MGQVSLCQPGGISGAVSGVQWESTGHGVQGLGLQSDFCYTLCVVGPTPVSLSSLTWDITDTDTEAIYKAVPKIKFKSMQNAWSLLPSWLSGSNILMVVLLPSWLVPISLFAGFSSPQPLKIGFNPWTSALHLYLFPWSSYPVRWHLISW